MTAICGARESRTGAATPVRSALCYPGAAPCVFT